MSGLAGTERMNLSGADLARRRCLRNGKLWVGSVRKEGCRRGCCIWEDASLGGHDPFLAPLIVEEWQFLSDTAGFRMFQMFQPDLTILSRFFGKYGTCLSKRSTRPNAWFSLLSVLLWCFNTRILGGPKDRIQGDAGRILPHFSN